MLKIILSSLWIIYGICFIYEGITEKKINGVSEGSLIYLVYSSIFLLTQINNLIQQKDYIFLILSLVVLVLAPIMYIYNKRITIYKLQTDKIIQIIDQVLKQFEYDFSKKISNKGYIFYDISTLKEIIKLEIQNSKDLHYIKALGWWKNSTKWRLMKEVIKSLHESQIGNIETKSNRLDQIFGLISVVFGIWLLSKSL